MDIFLTGATGFLGSHLLPRLLASGHKVYALSRRPLLSKGLDGLTTIEGDLIGNWPEKNIPWEKLDAVIHLAASGVKAANRNWPEALEVNINGTWRLLDAIQSRADKKPQFVFTRTFYEHLLSEAPALRENSYIATKAVAAKNVKQWALSYSGRVKLATVFQLYGKGDDAGSVLNYAARQIASGQPAHFGSGRGLRDWLHVTDAVDALVNVIESNSGAMSEWDLGCGQLVSIREMIETLARFTPNGGAQLFFDPSRDRADVDLRLAASKMVAGWQPKIKPEQGLRDLLPPEQVVTS